MNFDDKATIMILRQMLGQDRTISELKADWQKYIAYRIRYKPDFTRELVKASKR